MAATEYVIGVTAGDFYDFYNAGVVQAPTALTGGSNRFASSTNQVGMTVIDHTLYAGDGTDPNCRFDGLTVAKSGSMQPTSACAATESGSAGNIADGTVTYKITYLDADGHESEPSDASNTVTVTGGGSQVDLTSIPNDTDADRSGKNVYRLGTTSSEYRLVNSTPLSATATTYTDNIADGDLGAILIEGNTLFPPCARLWEHDNRMWGCGNAVDPRTLFGSNEFEPWYCPASPDITDPTQGVRVRVQGANANIVGGISHGGYNFAFTDEGGYIVHGTSAEDYRMERFTHHGCVSHRSIQSIRDWLFWVAPDGIYRYNGQNVDRIDEDIEVYFETQTAANLSLVASWSFDDRYYVSFPSGSGAVKCFDTAADNGQGAWTTLSYPDNFRVATVANSNSSSFGTQRPFVANETHGAVLQLEKPSTYDDSPLNAGAAQAISLLWRSKQTDMGLPWRDKRAHLWGFKVRNPASLNGASTSTVTTKLYLNGSTTASQTETDDLSVAGVGDDWSTTPASSRIHSIRHEATDLARAELFQFEIAHSAGGTGRISDFRLLATEAGWTYAS
jgi:hypothetical protein